MRRGLVLVGLMLAGVSAEAQTPAQPAPVFRSRVELVAVDVSVLDADGRPVPDLTLDDFTIRVDGQSRRLVSAQFVPLGSAARSRPAGVAVTHYSTNADAIGGRLIVLVVDRGNIRRGEGRPLMDAASRFIGQLEPTDRLALAVIPDSGPSMEFTTDHRSVQRTIGSLLGSATPPLSTYTIGLAEALAIAHQDLRTLDAVVGRECHTAAVMAPLQGRTDVSSRNASTAAGIIKACELDVRAEARLLYAEARQRTSASLMAMLELLNRLAFLGGPKTVVLLSEGLFVDPRETGEFQRVAAAAAAADATVYVVGLDTQQTDASMEAISPTFDRDRVMRRQGLEMLAGMARGQALSVATSGRTAFDRIARELSGYYVLGFEPEANDRDGEPHAIEVEARREGVEVRSRRHFLVDGGASRPTRDVLAEILRTPLPATELLLRAATYVYPSEGRQLRLVIAAEIEGAAAAGAVPCGFSLTDARGEVVGAEIEGPAALAAPVGDTHAYLASFVLDPGAYTLKIAAVDELGRRGSVEHRLDARLTPAGQIRVGDLMLADASPGRGRGVRPSIDTRMTSDEVIGYVELTSEVSSLLDGAAVTLEVAPVDSAAAVARADTRIERPTVGRRVAEGRLPTDLLPPGEYVARAVVSAGGRTVASVTRPFRLERPLESALTMRPAAPVPPGAGAPRLRGPAGLAGVQAFERQRVLTGDVVGYFLDRLPASAAATLSGPATAAIEAARRGQFEQVEPALAGAADEDLAAAFLRGLALLARNELNPAARAFRQAVQISHEFFAAAFYLGACYAAAGRDEEAAAAWQTALVTEAEAPFVYELLGDALLRQSEGQQAVDILAEARSIWPDDDRFLRRLAVAHAISRQHTEAAGALDRYLERHPDDRDAWLLGAWLVYDARLSGRPLGGPDEDLARLRQYRERYAALGGADVGLVDQWEAAVSRKR
jgi:VWFA-related protein